MSYSGRDSCSNDPCPDPPCCDEDGSSENPVRYAQGRILLSETDLDVGIPGLSHRRTFWNRNAENKNFDGPQGWNWFEEEWPYLVRRQNPENGYESIVLKSGLFPVFFDRREGRYTARYAASRRHFLKHDAGRGLFVYTFLLDDSSETIEFWDFDQPVDRIGMMHRRIDPQGHIITATGYDAMTITALETIRGTSSYRMIYNRNSSTGRFDEIHIEKETPGSPPVMLQKVTYQYTGTGDLQAASIQKPDPVDPEAFITTGIHFYRYYSGETFKHLLSTVVRPDTYMRLKAAGQDPLTMSTNGQGVDLVPLYADKRYTYDDGKRVVHEISRNDRGVSPTGLQGIAFQRQFNPRRGRQRRALLTETAYNRWVWKTTVQENQKTTKTIYSNAVGSTLLEVIRENGHPEHWWATCHRFDQNGRLVMTANESAVTGYDETLDDLVGHNLESGEFTHLSPDQGEVMHYHYFAHTTATVAYRGGAKGYPELTEVSQGYASRRIPLERWSYLASPSSGSGISRFFVVADHTVFRREEDSAVSRRTTRHTYRWHRTPTPRIMERVTTLPIVDPDENGSGVAESRREWFDTRGNHVALQDETGVITSFVYEQEREKLIQKTVDDSTAPAHSYWEVNPGQHLHLTSDYTYDDQGRLTLELGPEHEALDGETPRLVRSFLNRSYLERDVDEQTVGGDLLLDRNLLARGMHYEDGTPVFELLSPVEIELHGKGGSVYHRINALRSTGSGLLAPGDTFERSGWTRWSSEAFDLRGLLTAERNYFVIPEATTGLDGVWADTGSQDIHYYERTHDYAADAAVRLRSVGFCGDKTRRLYDSLFRLVEVWSGTQDIPDQQDATWQDWTPDAPGTDLVRLESRIYDEGLPQAPSRLTAILHYATEVEVREEHFTHDFRGRVTAHQQSGLLTLVHTYDNEDRRLSTGLHDGSAEGTLAALEDFAYDKRGRLYLSRRHAVNPITGAIGEHLSGQHWYSPRGELLRVIEPGAGQTLNLARFDAAGRQVLRGVAVANPQAPGEDLIIEADHLTLDAAGNTLSVARQEADLRDGPQSPLWRISYSQSWFDAIGRRLALANLGALDTPPARPATPPASTDELLVTAYHYNDAGELFETISPGGTVERLAFDAKGRTIARTENYVPPGDPGAGTNRITEWSYTPNDQIASQTLRFANPAQNQTTVYEYGVSLGPSLVASHSLLHKTRFPDDSEEVLEYNRLDEIIHRESPDGTVHELTWDLLRRMTEDSVTDFGHNLDKNISQRKISYNILGNPVSLRAGKRAMGSIPFKVENEVQIDYDAFGEWQEHDGKVKRQGSKPTRKILYLRSGGTGNSNPLERLHHRSGGIEVHSYGTPGGVDDRLNRVTAVAYGGEAQPSARFTYLGLRTLLGRELPAIQTALDLTGSGANPWPGLDRFARLADFHWKETDSGAATLARIEYGYNRDGLRLWRADRKAQAEDKNFDELYAYDGLSQITTFRRGRLNAQHDAIESGTQTRHDHWAFDEAGNWAAWEVDADSQSFEQERDHNALNQITAITQQPPPPWPTPHYDADGRTTRAPQANNPEESYRYEYDAWGNITKTFILNEYGHARTVSRYFYDARNYRIRAHIHPAESGPIAHFEDTYYDSQWRPLEKTRKGTGNTEPYKRYTRYLWSPSPADYPDTLIRRDRNTIPSSSDLNETLYALQDGHASTIALLNATNGQVVERYAYEAFGSPLFLDDDFEEQSTSSCDWETLYTGYPLEPNTGNYHVRYRTYHPALGRWMTRDPLFIPGRLVRPKDPIGKVDGLNLYGFAGNNGVNLVDHLGLSPCCSGQRERVQQIRDSLNQLRGAFSICNQMMLSSGLSASNWILANALAAGASGAAIVLSGGTASLNPATTVLAGGALFGSGLSTSNALSNFNDISRICDSIYENIQNALSELEEALNSLRECEQLNHESDGSCCQ